MNQDPYLPPGVRQRDLDGPDMTEDERQQRRWQAEDRAYDDFKDRIINPQPKKDSYMEANETVAGAAVVENSFTNTLNQMCDGEVASQLSTELGRVVCAVKEVGNPGELIFKMRIKPASAGVSALVVTADISVKLPKEDKPSSLFFTDKDGRLLRENPAQLKLPYRVLGEEKRATAIEIAAEPQPEVRQVS